MKITREAALQLPRTQDLAGSPQGTTHALAVENLNEGMFRRAVFRLLDGRRGDLAPRVLRAHRLGEHLSTSRSKKWQRASSPLQLR